MNIAIYSPYVCKHVGGGEKHILDIAAELSKNHQVSVTAPFEKDLEPSKWKKTYEDMFGLDLTSVTFTTTPLGTDAHFFKKLAWTARFDYLYSVTDGSLFFSLAKKNNLHIQIPFTNEKSSLVDRLKLANWSIKNTNSVFTKSVVEASWGTKITMVHYPSIDIQNLQTTQKKQPIILHVGRFFRQLHSKRQDVLIEVFKQMYRSHKSELKGWKLVLVGGVEDEAYFKELRRLAQNLPITFQTNATRLELVELYKKASIYWHATGFEVDDAKSPQMVEHFGISTLEAMAAGAVPLSVYKGGQKEILSDDLSYLGWTTQDECATKTIELITNKNQLEHFKQLSQRRSFDFSHDVFKRTLGSMF